MIGTTLDGNLAFRFPASRVIENRAQKQSYSLRIEKEYLLNSPLLLLRAQPLREDMAGYYPRFFEHAGIYNFIPTGAWTKFACIGSGFYGKEHQWLERIRCRFTRCGAFRRFNMKADGYAAVAGRIDRDEDS